MNNFLHYTGPNLYTMIHFSQYEIEMSSHKINITYNAGSIHPDSKIHGAYMGSTWGRQDPGRPHVGPTILAIWAVIAAIWLPIYAIWDSWTKAVMGSATVLDNNDNSTESAVNIKSLKSSNEN